MSKGQTSQRGTRNTTCKDDDEELIGPLSGNPFFHITLSRSSVRPKCRLTIPVEGAKTLPKKDVQATLVRGQKRWAVTYHGKGSQARFDDPSWYQFAVDNSLKINDVCIFELMKCSDTTITLKVQVLRGDFPAALQNKSRNSVGSLENPIVIG